MVLLDRESRDQYNVTVLCHDSGQPLPRSSDVTIDVRVTDENDVTPVFDAEQYVATLTENNAVGQFVSQVRAPPSFYAIGAMI